MPHDVPKRWLHRLAWLTAVVALLPISVGAVVTTVDAGMAFPDWPTSDGHGMFAYPWLRSSGEKFLEHGHRLAGSLVGLVSLGLGAVAFLGNVSWKSRLLTGAIVAGVIVQGLLGAWRVLADERVGAMIHGLFGTCVFVMMGLLVATTATSWESAPKLEAPRAGRTALIFGWLTLLVTTLQVVLGSELRHLKSAHAWLVHPWFALAVVLMVVAFAVASWSTTSSSIRRAALWCAGLVAAQALLGLATWGVRYGFPQWGIVAVQQSPLQIGVRSLHTVLAMITVTTMVVAVFRIHTLLPSAAHRDAPAVSLPKQMIGGLT